MPASGDSVAMRGVRCSAIVGVLAVAAGTSVSSQQSRNLGVKRPPIPAKDGGMWVWVEHSHWGPHPYWGPYPHWGGWNGDGWKEDSGDDWVGDDWVGDDLVGDDWVGDDYTSADAVDDTPALDIVDESVEYAEYGECNGGSAACY